GDAVDGDVEVDAPLRGRAREVDLRDLDVAAAQEVVADGLGPIGDGSEALVAQLPRRVLQPLLRGLDGGDGGVAAHGVARDGHPRRELDGEGTPAVLASGQLRGGGVTEGLDLGPQSLRSHLEVAGEAGQLDTRARRDHLLPVGQALQGGRAQLVEAHAGRALDDLGGRDRQAQRRLAGGFPFAAGGGGGRGRFAEGGGFLLLLLVPLLVEGALAVADGAPAVSVRVVEGERLVQQVRELPGAAGDGAGDRALRLLRLAQAIGGPGDVFDRRRGDRGQALEGAHRGLVLRCTRRPREDLLRAIEVPLLLVQGLHDLARAIVVRESRAQGGHDLLLHLGRALVRLLAQEPGVAQAVLAGDEVLQAEDRGQAVVELRGA